jgi:hypothetical protein
MLRSSRVSRCVPSASNLSVRRGSPSRPEAEQRLKGGHRLPPTIVPKDELVQVDLKLRLTDPVVRADQPLLQVADGAVRERHRGSRASAQGERLRAPNVRDARSLQVLEAFQAVGVERRPRTDVLLDELDHRRLFEVRDYRHSGATRDAAAVFNRHDNNGLLSAFELTTASQARLWPADPGVVDLHLTMQRLTRRVDHGTPQRNSIHAVSYRRSPSCRWTRSAEIPRLSVVMRYAAQNHAINGIFVL